ARRIANRRRILGLEGAGGDEAEQRERGDLFHWGSTISTQFDPLPVGYFCRNSSAPLAGSIAYTEIVSDFSPDAIKYFPLASIASVVTVPVSSFKRYAKRLSGAMMMCRGPVPCFN